MDEFSDFFDFSKTFQRKTLAPGTNDGRIIVGVDFERKTIERENFETEYGDVFVDELREEMEKMCRVSQSLSSWILPVLNNTELKWIYMETCASIDFYSGQSQKMLPLL